MQSMIWIRRKEMIKGIDVSSWQGNINFVNVKASGIQFVILKAGGSDGNASAPFYTDKRFRENYDKASQAGLSIGAYYFVGKKCKSSVDGIADAQRFYNIIKDCKLDYPVYIDFEAPDSSNKQGNTDAVNAFCLYMESLGYYVGIYASDISGFKDRLYLEQLTRFDKWVARYGSEPKYVKNWGIWQSSSKGNIPGIAGHVDLDYSRNDYSGIIKKYHLNGF